MFSIMKESAKENRREGTPKVVGNYHLSGLNFKARFHQLENNNQKKT